MNATTKHDGIRLTTGQKYDVDTLFLAGWSTGEDHRIGYHYSDYFRDGVYLGPDADGVEPLFVDPRDIVSE